MTYKYGVDGAPVYLSRRIKAYGPIMSAAAGWWLSGGITAANCLAAYAPKGAASYVASKINLANPGTYNAAEGNAPTWDAVNGWTFDGTNNYLVAGAIPYLSTFSIVAKARLAATAGGYYAILSRGSVFENATNYDLALRWVNATSMSMVCYGREAGTLRGTEYATGNRNNTDIGTAYTWKTGANNYNSYLDGAIAPVQTLSHNVGTDGGQNVLIGSPNTPGASDKRFIGRIYALALYDVILTAAQQAAVYAAMP